MIRILDIIFSLIALIILLPLLLITALVIAFTSKGGAFYKQKRVGQDNKDFTLFKFRTMYVNSDSSSLITIGEKDSRITKFGYFLRKYKLDELPQLFNVLIGNMSIVGPRPEVRKYVDLYTKEQQLVLTVKPGLTDYASIEYINENELLAHSEDPEKLYKKKIMGEKIKLNIKFIRNKTVGNYLFIIGLTIKKILK